MMNESEDLHQRAVEDGISAIASTVSPTGSNANLTHHGDKTLSNKLDGGDDEPLLNTQSIASTSQVGDAEIVDTAISITNSSAKFSTNDDIEVFEDTSRSDSKSIPLTAIERGDHDDFLENGPPSVVPHRTSALEVGNEPYDVISTGDSDFMPPMTHIDPFATSDDVSSLHNPFGTEEKRKQNIHQVHSLPVHFENDSLDEYTLRSIRRRNFLVTIILILFVGLVCAIGSGIILAVKNKNASLKDADVVKDEFDEIGGGIDAGDLFATQQPTQFTTQQPTLSLESFTETSNSPISDQTSPNFAPTVVHFPPSAAPIAKEDTLIPTETPSSISTNSPTVQQSLLLTQLPTQQPNNLATIPPTLQPSNTVTTPPTLQPPNTLTTTPTLRPTNTATSSPTLQPSQTITSPPTLQPSNTMTSSPTLQPSQNLTTSPTLQPSNALTTSPTLQPSETKCQFCAGVTMPMPNLELALGQTCQTVQDRATSLSIDDSNCGLLKLVEASCCNPK